MRLEIDRTRCIASGNCVADDPAVFDFGDDGLAMIATEDDLEPTPQLLETVRNCPARAILVDGTDWS